MIKISFTKRVHDFEQEAIEEKIRKFFIGENIYCEVENTATGNTMNIRGRTSSEEVEND